MTDHLPTSDPSAAAADRLDDAVGEISDMVKEVRALRTSNRKLRLVLVIVFVVAVFAGTAAVAAFVGLGEARHGVRVATQAADLASRQAVANLETLRVSCEATNESRTNTVAVWETFVHIISPEDTRTPEAQAKVDELLDFIRNTYKARDCSQLGETPSP